MCNRYNVKTNLQEIASEIGAQIAFDFQYAEEIFPGQPAPTLVINRDGDTELRPMKFGFGSMGGGGPALNNARVESIEKWTWKKSFQRFRCIVPMTGFREPCYWGPLAGHELNFQEANGKLLLAAAIFSFDRSAPAANRLFDESGDATSNPICHGSWASSITILSSQRRGIAVDGSVTTIG